jgi:5S rRNA maturation endonuclease (ribonuclease M5)
MDALREVLLPRLEGIKASGGSWMAKCPAHEDAKASLHIAYGKLQPVVMTCHAGCERDDILKAIGLTWDDLCKPRDGKPAVKGEWTPAGDAIAVYDYVSEDGELLFQVLRTADKQFRQRTPDSSRQSGYRWSLEGVRRVIYRLPKVIEAVKDGYIIWVVEGEKDVHALEGIGEVATCNPGGAGKWRPEYSELFRDAIVRIVADKDKPGQAHARQIAASLEDIAATVEIAEGAGECKDISEHLAAGFTIGQLEITHESGAEPRSDLAPDLYEFIAVVDPPNEWILPELLERGDRLIWTGFEGLGKSVMTRQLAVSAAAGMQPFTGERFPPQRVLFIDCENPDRKSRRHFRKLEAIARGLGYPVPEGGLRILQRTEGVDLTQDEDAAWLLERVTAHRPDLLAIGPFYKLHATDANEEKAARAVVGVLDAALAKAGCALITEAHAGHGQGSDRSVRPTGSSLLMRWPEFGYGIKPDGPADEWGRHHNAVIVPWRGPREERHWPRQICWGTPEIDWPWVPYFTTPGNARMQPTPIQERGDS